MSDRDERRKKGGWTNEPARPRRSAFHSDEGEPANTREQADRQERRLSKATGAQMTRGSGSTRHIGEKGDLKDPLRVWESKTTTKRSRSLSRTELAKVGREAMMQGKHAVHVTTWEGDLEPGLARDYATIPLDYLLELIRVAEAGS